MLRAGVNRARRALVSTRTLNRWGLRALACRGDYNRDISRRVDDAEFSSVPRLQNYDQSRRRSLPQMRARDSARRPRPSDNSSDATMVDRGRCTDSDIYNLRGLTRRPT